MSSKGMNDTDVEVLEPEELETEELGNGQQERPQRQVRVAETAEAGTVIVEDSRESTHSGSPVPDEPNVKRSISLEQREDEDAVAEVYFEAREKQKQTRFEGGEEDARGSQEEKGQQPKDMQQGETKTLKKPWSLKWSFNFGKRNPANAGLKGTRLSAGMDLSIRNMTAAGMNKIKNKNKKILRPISIFSFFLRLNG